MTLEFLGGALALGVAIAPTSAFACFDGYVAHVGSVSVTSATAMPSWNVADARFATTWAARIDGLVPAGVDVNVSDGYIECTGDAACDNLGKGAGSEHLGEAFRRVADAFGVSAEKRAAAARITQPVYTVQVFSGSAENALALRDRINAMFLSGNDDGTVADGDFFDQGGFPAFNPPAHAVADPTDPKLVRVVVDEFPNQAGAQDAQQWLAHAGFPGFVEELPTGAALKERVSSR